VSTWTRGVIAFDLATKLTDGDGDTAMDEDGSLAQHGFADYTLPPERCVSCRPTGHLDVLRTLAGQTATAVDHESALQFSRE